MQNMEISSPSVEICIICKFPKEPKCFCFTGNVSVEMPKSHQLSAIGQAYAYHRDGNTASLLDVPQKQQDLHAKKFQAQQDSRLESHQEQPPKKYYSN
jgi:hypothetical protein